MKSKKVSTGKLVQALQEVARAVYQNAEGIKALAVTQVDVKRRLEALEGEIDDCEEEYVPATTSNEEAGD